MKSRKKAPRADARRREVVARVVELRRSGAAGLHDSTPRALRARAAARRNAINDQDH
ncbi:hypothetical protein [Microbispora sp. NPDC049125]|uniref:hypothetical protein n=1 Tax=Microbispora sp. NPDC049125 TaxID=3154929 RepID=UPI003466FA21